MDTKFVEISLVILAREHNPTILNSDFLYRNKIVAEEWGWRPVGQAITTPALSTVHFDSQVAITVEATKLQVTDISGRTISESHICTMLSNYVRVLEHVPYTAFGVNFTSIAEPDDANAFLIGRFLKEGNWNNDKNRMLGLGVKFAYPVDGGQITFSIDSAERPDMAKPFIISRANFHRELDMKSMPTSKQILNHLDNLQNDWERYQELSADIFGND